MPWVSKHILLPGGYICRAAQAINEVLGEDRGIPLHLNVAKFDSIRSFAKDFLARDEPLHFLLNNAGL